MWRAQAPRPLCFLFLFSPAHPHPLTPRAEHRPRDQIRSAMGMEWALEGMCGNSQPTIRAVRAGRGRCEERVCDEGLGRPSGCGAATHRTNVRRPGGGRQWQAGSVAGRTFTGSLTTHVGASVGAWACSACLRAEAVQMCVPRREPGGAGEVCSGRNSWAVVRAAGCAAGAQQARAVPCGQEAAHCHRDSADLRLRLADT